jgi:hypothetical protein
MLNNLKITTQNRTSEKVPALHKPVDQVVLVIKTAIEEANYGE